MRKTTVEKIAMLAAAGNCPCNCHIPAVCDVSEPFGHHDCVECWTALIEEACSLDEAESRAEAVWAVIVAVCGADPEGRGDFVFHAIRGPLPEYRFQGSLGWGGKVHLKSPPQVSCYSEDENPKRRRMIDSANELLAAIAKLWQEGD